MAPRGWVGAWETGALVFKDCSLTGPIYGIIDACHTWPHALQIATQCPNQQILEPSLQGRGREGQISEATIRDSNFIELPAVETSCEGGRHDMSPPRPATEARIGSLEPGRPSLTRSANTRHPAGRPHTPPANRMYATDVRQTDVRRQTASPLNAPWAGHYKYATNFVGRLLCVDAGSNLPPYYSASSCIKG